VCLSLAALKWIFSAWALSMVSISIEPSPTDIKFSIKNTHALMLYSLKYYKDQGESFREIFCSANLCDVCLLEEQLKIADFQTELCVHEYAFHRKDLFRL
jgi:hypothetical protein